VVEMVVKKCVSSILIKGFSTLTRWVKLKLLIVYYVMRSKNEVLCAAAGRLVAERSEADKPAEAHKTIFAPNNIYYFFFKPS
jgi:hypothetical protein